MHKIKTIAGYTKSFSNQTQMVHRHLDGSEIGMNSPTVCYHMYAYYEDDFLQEEIEKKSKSKMLALYGVGDNPPVQGKSDLY